MRKAIFTLDPLGDQTFSGYTDGGLWNGWAIPSFPKEEAERLVSVWNALGYKADYDGANDFFASLQWIRRVTLIQTSLMKRMQSISDQ